MLSRFGRFQRVGPAPLLSRLVASTPSHGAAYQLRVGLANLGTRIVCKAAVESLADVCADIPLDGLEQQPLEIEWCSLIPDADSFLVRGHEGAFLPGPP